MALSTLSDIQKMVRSLAVVPSTQQWSDAQLNNYINLFIQSDFPSLLRLFPLKKTFKFYTAPNIDTYETDLTDLTAPLYNFKNRFVTIHPPIYIAGMRATYTQSLDALYNVYSKIQYKAVLTTSDGTTGPYADATISNTPFLQNNVIISATAANNQPITLIDIPRSPADGMGNLIVPNDDSVTYGTVDYVSGLVSNLTLPVAPVNGTTIYSQVVPYTAGIPTMMCYYGDQFILRPVPDGEYSVEMEVYMRPAELIASSDSPELEQWAQFIAYGAAIKICQMNHQQELVAELMFEFERQREMVINTTAVQNSNKRVATPFAEQVDSDFAVNNRNIFNNC